MIISKGFVLRVLRELRGKILNIGFLMHHLYQFDIFLQEKDLLIVEIFLQFFFLLQVLLKAAYILSFQFQLQPLNGKMGFHSCKNFFRIKWFCQIINTSGLKVFGF